jgi:hypothetical protein
VPDSFVERVAGLLIASKVDTGVLLVGFFPLLSLF